MTGWPCPFFWKTESYVAHGFRDVFLMSSTISRVLYQMVIYLDCTSPRSSFAPGAKRDIPEDATGRCMVFCLPCSGWGLHSLSCYQQSGGLLHRHSTLTDKVGGFFSIALSFESPRPDVIRHPALWSPDFPHPHGGRDHLCYSALS